MPWWPFGRKQAKPIHLIAPPTYALEQRANAAFFGRRWKEAERLYLEVLAKADQEGRQVARNMLGQVYERQGRVDDAIASYEANLAERCPFTFYIERLAIIYRRQGRPDDERRVLVYAAQFAPNPKTRQWCADRLRKMK